MPPKPRIVRKPPAGTKNPSTVASPASAAKDAGAMPPPPVPAPPQAILEPEMNALSGCLRNTGVRTGQIYYFYDDARRMGIDKYAPQPPQSMNALLGREMERFDRLCDAVEAHLSRAISVLQRDLEREKDRLKAEEEAEALKVKLEEKPMTSTIGETSLSALGPSESHMTPAKLPITGQPSSVPTDAVSSPGLQRTPPTTGIVGPPSGRRPSTVSLSSLNRPQFPHKLDLSAAALRINPEEITQGLASPVTLAPLLASTEAANAANRTIDIDLTTLPDEPARSMNMDVDPSLGSSAERPIELDLDGMEIDMSTMEGLFGESNPNNSTDAATVDLFQRPAQSAAASENKKAGETLDVHIMDALSGSNTVPNGEDIFGTLENNLQPSNQAVGRLTPVPLPSVSDSAGQPSAPSPRSILASLAAAGSVSASTKHHAPTEGTGPFDVDFGDFSTNFNFDTAPGGDVNFPDMEAFLNMDGVSSDEKTQG
ncbi:hypothetical protein EW146_g474 [Bondarzewia mesenterica]|uniref:Uncharacterized protein n=1 Tax=Bondarzewia mesenterica TaxID=1095465 RepID=A0A4S4M8R4_9AGAM|nr:hypothetical protein EW146_g474 [Bondarzewia mesenterica]